MTTTSDLLKRFDISASMKMLLFVLRDKALSDGSVQITLYRLEHDINLTGTNVCHNLAVLKMTRDLDYEITHYPEGDQYDIRLLRSRQAVSIG